MSPGVTGESAGRRRGRDEGQRRLFTEQVPPWMTGDPHSDCVEDATRLSPRGTGSWRVYPPISVPHWRTVTPSHECFDILQLPPPPHPAYACGCMCTHTRAKHGPKGRNSSGRRRRKPLACKQAVCLLELGSEGRGMPSGMAGSRGPRALPPFLA